MKDRKLAVRYARALLSALPDPAEAEAADTFLTALGEAIADSSEIRDMLLDPAVSRPSRRKALAGLAERAGASRKVRNFFDTLVDNNRLAALPSIAVVFHEQRERAAGIVPAELTTASPISEEMKARARDAVEKLTGRKVRLICNVEPALIGGAVTKIGSTVYDGSLRTQLTQLRRRMAQE